MTSTGIFCIIINKFGYRKYSSLTVLFVIDKNLKIGFDIAILPLNLAITLKKKPLKAFA